jgi:hypothetical protein
LSQLFLKDASPIPKLGATRYHDFHLREYRVSDFGKRITLDLVFDYAGKPKEESRVEFSDAALYNFGHTGGAVITEIEEASLDDLLDEVGGTLTHWNKQSGITGWCDSLENYRASLHSAGLKAWRVASAIGFYGFIMAGSVRQVAPSTSLERGR